MAASMLCRTSCSSVTLCREEVQQLLAPIVADAKQPVDIWALSALSLGMVFIKSA
jgi:hypothetical protein